MIYFSELKGKKILSEDKIPVGVLEDLIFLSSESPNVTKLVVRSNLENKLVIPIEYLVKINQEIIIEKKYQVSELQANELFILKNLLDKQIIDLVGNKVVRVNDIAFQDKDGFYVTGVDIGILGVLRWFKVADLVTKIFSIFGLRIKPVFLSWADIQPLELARGHVMLKKREEKLTRIKAEDLADYLEKTNIVNIGKILKILDERKAGEVIGNLNLNFRVTLFRHFKPEKSATLLNHIDPDDAVDILLTLSKRRQEEIMKYLSDKKKKELNYLMGLATTPIGELLTTEFIKIKPEITVREVVDEIKKETVDFTFLNTVYVVNEKDQLVGVFNLHELLLQDQDTPVYKFMVQHVIVVHLTTPVEIAVKKILKYRLNALPVIDENKKLLGIITFDDLTGLMLGKMK